MKALAKLLMKMGGWKMKGGIPKEDKAIIISAPHTSVWDWYWGELSFLVAGVPVYIPIKKEFFFFPVGYLLKALHAIPVDRGKRGNNTLDTLAGAINKYDRACVCITPEGTRKLRKRWKKGFLVLSYKTGMPVYLGGLNYEEKYTWIAEEPFPLTGDVEADLKAIQNSYRDARPKYPEQFSIGD